MPHSGEGVTVGITTGMGRSPAVLPCCAGSTAKDCLCFLPTDLPGPREQHRGLYFPPWCSRLPRGVRNRPLMGSKLTLPQAGSGLRSPVPVGSGSPLSQPCSPQDEVLELLWDQNDGLQCLPGAAGLQHGAALLDGKGGKGWESSRGALGQVAAGGRALNWHFRCDLSPVLH